MSRNTRRPTIASRPVVPGAHVVGTPERPRLETAVRRRPDVKVALVEDFRVVLTGGHEAGATAGDLYDVVGGATAILDPDTKEPLGEVPTVKASLRVTQVRDRLSVCEYMVPVERFDHRGWRPVVEVGDIARPVEA